MIKRELRQRGVAEAAIEAALKDFDSAGVAYRAVARYASRQANLRKAAFDRRVGSFLDRRGFAPGIMRETLHRLHVELDLQDDTGPSLLEF